MKEIIPQRIPCFVLLLVLTAAALASAQVVPAPRTAGIPDDLDQFIPGQMQKWKVPGLAIAVVQNGQVIYSHGFGLRDVKANLPVTTKTIFAIGSISKSFTSLSMGILNDEGKLDWDKPVRQYLPEFQIYDPVASERMTPRDLISHRVGMAGHDLVWYSSDFRCEELVHRLRFLQSNRDFRSGYRYNNMLVMTAGYLVGKISGQSWEDFVHQRIFQPLQKVGVVTVTTMDAANAVTNIVARQTLRMMLAVRTGKPAPQFESTTPVSPELARKLAGRYGDGDDAVNLIDREGTLHMLATGGGFESQLRTSGDALVADGRLDIDPDTKIIPVDGGIRIAGKLLKRVELPRPAPSPENFAGLIGQYGWDHDVLYVFEKDGKLNVLIEWFEYDPLEQQSTDTFKFPAHGLYNGETAIFTRDASGRATQVKIGAVPFKRREEASGLQVHPTESIAKLRRLALAAKPPVESKSFRAPDLVDLTTVVPNVKLDIRYASSNNFLGSPVYEQGKAFLQRPAAEALARAAQKLQPLGYGFLIHDAYRPWYVTKIFWDATPQDKKIFVANPQEGSRHNRGCAVDLTLYDLKTGAELRMTGAYDEMSERSYAFYSGGTSLQRWDRNLLRNVLEAEGFTVYEYEWWHFDYNDWQQYRILNSTFEQLSHPAAQSGPMLHKSILAGAVRLQGYLPAIWNAILNPYDN